MSRPATILWFARHELRLEWRDWIAMMTAGRRTRARWLAVVLAVFALFMHGVARSMLAPFADAAADPDRTALVVVTGSALLSWLLLVSQAMESVTRGFYSRADLDLLLSSPIAAERIFAVRLAAIALSIMAMAALIASPFVDVLALRGGAHWLLAYPAVMALGALAAALAAVATTALFRLIGPKRTRLVAQIVAAVIGAGFVIGLQLGAIVSTGTLSRLAVLASAPVVSHAPGPGSALWWPARALLGEPEAVAAMLAFAALALVAAIAIVAPRFAGCSIAAASTTIAAARHAPRAGGFRIASPIAMLRRKEWTLLRRDPWLVSQTLMQLLYLLPPALMLWRSFGNGAASVLLVPVLVMAAGQLGGGLAWIAISGEDAPDLVATAPLTARAVIRAKIEAVLGVIALVFAPFVAALVFLAPSEALVCAIGIAVAAASATQIQLCFRAQARRSQFRRRQTSSRFATFAEAFVSIAWAATAALAASGTTYALMPGAVAIGILASAHAIGPQKV